MRQFRSVNDYIVDNRYPFKRYDTFVAAARDNNVDLHIKTSEREKEREKDLFLYHRFTENFI